MKILYLITKSNWGGAQKYVFDLALSMKNENHNVAVAFGGEGALYEKLKEKDIKTFNIKNLERDVSIIKELKVFRDLYFLFKKEKPDIIHLNSSKIGGSGAFIGRLAGIKKIIYTAHGFPFREERPFWQILIITFLSWLTVLFSHKTICVSQKDFDDIAKFPFVKEKICMVHNGIQDIRHKTQDARENTTHPPTPSPREGGEIQNTHKSNIEANASLGEAGERSETDGFVFNTDTIKIVSIGELHKNKGFIYALESINILKEKIENFSYTILTFGGDEKEILERKIKDLNLENFVNIYYLNKDEKANEMLLDYDIYFMPSIKEGLPYVLLEAGLYSLPIVASDTGGINEIIENYKNGFLLKVKDVNGFVLAIERLIKDKDLREEFGKNIREKIEKDFDIKDMIRYTKDIYLEK